jgi:hypothetical protein
VTCLALLLILELTGYAGAEPVQQPDAGIWNRTFSSCGLCEGQAVTITPDGGIAATGTSWDREGRQHLFIQKTSAAGTEQWIVTTADRSCTGSAIASTGPEGVAVLGSCTDGSGAAILTVLEDTDGRARLSKIYDLGMKTTGTALLAPGDGGYFMVAEADTLTIGRSVRDVIFRRLDSEGNVIWDRTYSDTFSSAPAAVAAAPEGGFVIAGPAVTGSSQETDILIVRLDASGTELWRQVFGTEDNDSPKGVLAAGDGGFLVVGSACKPEPATACRIYVLQIDAKGIKVWDNRYGLTGTERAAAVVKVTDGGYTITGSIQSADPAATGRDILILHIDDSGTELWSRTIGTDADESVTGATLSPGGSLILTGSVADPAAADRPSLLLMSIGSGGMDPPAGLLQKRASSPQGSVLKVTVRDTKSGATIPGALVYYDGKLAGSTSGEGIFSLAQPVAGSHSVRVTGEGYRETTVMVEKDTGPDLDVRLKPSVVHRILGAGSPERSFDIVFVPSDTSYDCTLQQKVATDRYTGHQEIFVNDVRSLTGATLLQLPTFSAVPSQIPGDYTQQLNIYYYWDNDRFADAFSGCAGTLPEGFWDKVPFADVAVILYPSYAGRYTGSPCEPQGCTNGVGAGLQSWIKVPADRSTLFMHESGHALFGLVDTYCGDTFYTENLPYPNLWGSGTNCTNDASLTGRDISLCRPLADGMIQDGAGCGNGFWKFDPVPDLMGATGDGALFGEASTRRIQYVLEIGKRT